MPITSPQAMGLMQQAQGATGPVPPAATRPVPPAAGGTLSGPPRQNNVG